MNIISGNKMYVGIDHSTTGIRSSIIGDDGEYSTFSIDQFPEGDHEWSYTELLAEHVDVDDVEMIAYGYSYGDRFAKIKPIEQTVNRGLETPTGLGSGSGGGTLVFDELRESSLPCVVFPGVNEDLETIHPYFSYHSPMTGADKVAMSRYAQEVTPEDANFIATCMSSSEIATLVLNEKLHGAFTWMGLVHGWPASRELHKVKHGQLDLDDLIIQSGFFQRSGRERSDVEGIPDAHFLDMICCSTSHNVYSLFPFAKMAGEDVDAIVISGRLSQVTDPVDVQKRVRETVSDIAPVHFCTEYSTSRGAAYIARDVSRGKSEVLGIPVEADTLTDTASQTESQTSQI